MASDKSIGIKLNEDQINLIIEALDTYCYTIANVVGYDEGRYIQKIKQSILDSIPDECF